jgi:hypothetical protein
MSSVMVSGKTQAILANCSVASLADRKLPSQREGCLMLRFVVERLFDTPQSDAELAAGGIRERPCLDMYQVAWRRSLLSSDRLRMVCEYEAPDAESVRKVQREAGNSFERVWLAEVIE